MTEEQKCLAGELYYTDFPGRHNQHLQAADLCFEYNHTKPSNMQRRTEIIHSLFKHVGKECYIEPLLHCSFGFNLSVGDYFFANNNCLFMDDAAISFGDHVLIGPGCHFYTAEHPIDPTLRVQKLERALPITVGNNVWFGGHCTVLPGVTIGNNAVIGAGSVVTRNIPDNTIAVGVPCRVVRSIHAQT